MSEEKESGNITLQEYREYLGQSPGLCCSMIPLLFAVVPFVLLGFLRFFIASWASAPISQ